MNIEENFFYIWLAWGSLGLATFLFLRFNKNARLKRVVYPLVLVVTTTAFLWIVWSMMRGGPFIYIFSAFAILITISNYRRTAFCDACGAMSYSSNLFKPPVECASCGSKWI